MRRGTELAGLALAGYCVLNGSFVPAVAKLTTHAATGLTSALFTSAFAGVMALAFLVARGQLPLLFERRDFATLLAIGALGTAAAFFLYYSGAKRVTAIEAALCVQTEPIYSLLGTRFLLGHPLPRRRIAAVCAIAAGIALAIGARPTSSWLGLSLLLATPLAWQASHWVALRNLSDFNPTLLSGARYVYGTLVLFAAWLAVEGGSGLPARTELAGFLATVAFQGALLAFGGTLAWYAAVKRLDLTRTTAIVVPSAPIVSLLVSYLVLGEAVTARQACGFALTAAGVLAFALSPSVTHPVKAEPSLGLE
ncbi:MAG TPA: DMT family transporter [Myxococcota bacterium]|nr:DMT family transporter [Myxococcota bacterium]